MIKYPDNNSNTETFLDIVWQYKYHLAIYTIVVSFLSFTILYSVGGVPNELQVIDESGSSVQTNANNSSNTPRQAAATRNPVAVAPANVQPAELPQRVIIEKIGVDALVSNPTVSGLDALNRELLKGAVRYPGSGTLGQGNMFIFGHSSGIRVVNNQAYKAFNGLDNLNIGDAITVRSAGKEYTYKVQSVAMVVSDEEMVEFSSDKNMLTLSTCNVFGQKEERFVVQADFVKVRPL